MLGGKRPFQPLEGHWEGNHYNEPESSRPGYDPGTS